MQQTNAAYVYDAPNYAYDATRVSFTIGEKCTLRGTGDYTALEFDQETGLYYYRARYYSSDSGRFLNEDPTGFEGGVNEYAYASNSPASYFDPFGLDAWKKTHSWGRADIQAYSNYMKDFVKSMAARSTVLIWRCSDSLILLRQTVFR